MPVCPIAFFPCLWELVSVRWCTVLKVHTEFFAEFCVVPALVIEVQGVREHAASDGDPSQSDGGGCFHDGGRDEGFRDL
jgi:hypothetical protein